ncbi:MAG: DUF84 family protein [Patescibacteria group bacterium]
MPTHVKSVNVFEETNKEADLELNLVKEIALGSKSKLKRDALRLAMRKLKIMSIKVTEVGTESGVKEQPVGYGETGLGARNRAQTARMARPEAIGIGIESGVVAIAPGKVYDFAVVYIISGANRPPVSSVSAEFEFPHDCFVEAQSIGFDTMTVGKIIAQKHGGKHDNPHMILSNGKVSRTTLIAEAIETALRGLHAQ